jgi:hypothetical protein
LDDTHRACFVADVGVEPDESRFGSRSGIIPLARHGGNAKSRAQESFGDGSTEAATGPRD